MPEEPTFQETVENVLDQVKYYETIMDEQAKIGIKTPLPKLVESDHWISQTDTDSHGQLSRSRALDYLLSARNLHLLKAYKINTLEHEKKYSSNWVSYTIEIQWLRPIRPFEEVQIQSQLIGFDETDSRVKIQLLDKDKKFVKLVALVTYRYQNMKTGKAGKHPKEIDQIFKEISLNIPNWKEVTLNSILESS